MFHNLIATNKPAPDPRAGSNVVLGGESQTFFMLLSCECIIIVAYAAACTADNQVLTAEQTLLELPSNWDGPFVAILPVGGAAVAVAVCAFFGVLALLILSNLA